MAPALAVLVALSGCGGVVINAAENAQFTLNASTLNFGNVALHTTSTKTLTITSSGNAALTVNSITIAGTEFSITGVSFPATVQPGQTLTIQVSFAPSTPSTANGSIEISTNSAGASHTTVPLTGHCTASPQAQLSLSASAMDFGDVILNSASTKTLTLTSTGNSPLRISSVGDTGSGFAVAGGSFPATLNPGESIVLQVSFKPAAAGAATGAITIASNSGDGSTSTVALAGTGTQVASPQLTVSAASINFGSVLVNSSSKKVLTLTSSGSAPLTLRSVTAVGSGFAISGATFPTTLNPGQSVTLQASFSPSIPGAAIGTITVSSNSSTGKSTTVALSGTGTASQIPDLTLSANALSFGNVTVKTTSSKTLTLTSSGTAALTINSVAVAGSGFALSGAAFPATLNPGQSITVQVSFDPTVTGAATGSVTVVSNASSGTTQTIALTGTGTTAQSPNLTLSANSIAFGNLAVKTTSTKTLTLTSSGTAALTINSVAVTGSGFALSGAAFPARLNPGQSVTVQVSFDPTVTGAATGSVTVVSNALSGATQTIALTGTGTTAQSPNLTLSANSIAFGSITVKTTSTKTLTLTSSGTAALTINSVAVTGNGFALSGAAFPVTLNPSQSVTLQVSFDPTKTGAATGSVTVLSNVSSGATQTIALTGTGTTAQSPNLTLSANSIAFGSITVKTTSTKTLTLASSGTAALTINSVAVAGSGFALSGAAFPATLNPGQSVTVQVSFDPTVTGAATGSVTVVSNASSGATQTIALTGTGTTAQSPNLTLSANSIAFGSITVKTTSTKTLTLTSSGTAALTINSVAVAGSGFALSGAAFPATLNPGQSVTVQVSFDPTVTGAATGNVTITSNSSGGNTSTVALTGTGVANAILTVSTTKLSFGSDPLNTPISLPVTLTSTGTSPVTVSSATISGAGFTFSGATFPVTLNPNIAITIQVQFDPTSTGALSGSLIFTSTSTTGGQSTVSLTGTGTATQHQVTLNWSAPVNSPDAVSGYKVYRATGSGSSFALLNSSSATSYVDLQVSSGATYLYYVTSVDTSGSESAPSNQVTVTVP